MSTKLSQKTYLMYSDTFCPLSRSPYPVYVYLDQPGCPSDIMSAYPSDTDWTLRDNNRNTCYIPNNQLLKVKVINTRSNRAVNRITVIGHNISCFHSDFTVTVAFSCHNLYNNIKRQSCLESKMCALENQKTMDTGQIMCQFLCICHKRCDIFMVAGTGPSGVDNWYLCEITFS